jgi:predicted nucleic acid-binding protein
LEKNSIEAGIKPIPLVLDSSAIISLFFKEKFENQIVRIIESQSHFATVDLSFAEIGSAAWKSIVIFKQTVDPIREALRLATDFISENCNVVSSKEIAREAFELGTKHKIQIYDSLFLSLAKKLGSQVLTTDERLHNKVNQIKELQGILYGINFKRY